MLAGIRCLLHLITIAVWCSVGASSLGIDANSLLRRTQEHQHDQQQRQALVPESTASPAVRHKLRLQQQAADHHLRRTATAGNDTQHPQAAHADTPGSRMSRAVPEEWKPAVSWFATILLFAFFYKRLAFYVPDLDPAKTQDPDLSFKEWRHELFDCCDEPFFCIMSIVFPSLVLADNLTKSRLGAFFATVIVSGFLIAFNSMVLVLPWCAFAMYCTYHRQSLRSLFEMEQDEQSMCNDCLLYLFCNPCTLTQDARHIQEAAQAGHPAVERDRTRLRMYC